MPSPNVALGVDLFNCFSYTRMPSMIGEVSKSSVDNTIPIMKMDPENVDLCLNRLKIHFYVLFRLSKCFNLCKIQFDNGKCQFTREHFFQVELLYDFNQYQITKLKIFVNNNEVFNIINLMNYILNYNLNSFSNSTELSVENNENKDNKNTVDDRKDNLSKDFRENKDNLDNKDTLDLNKNEEDKNIFDVLYNILNDYIGKMIMKYLYKQSINYCNAKFVVFQYNLDNNPNSTNNNNMDNKDAENHTLQKDNLSKDFRENNYGDNKEKDKNKVELLSIDCFVKYKYKYRFKNNEDFGLVMKFVRHESGDVDLNVDELDMYYPNIYNYHLDHWIQLVSSKLETYQFRVVEEQVSRLKEQEKRLLLMLKDNKGNKLFDKCKIDSHNLVKYYINNIDELYITNNNNNGDNKDTENDNNMDMDNKVDNKNNMDMNNILDEIWVNRMNGSLNLKGYQGEFNLSDSKMIFKLKRIIELLEFKFNGFNSFNFQLTGPNHFVDKSECPLCYLVNEGSDVEMEDEVVDNNLVGVLLGGNKHILHNTNNNLHLYSSYLIYSPDYIGNNNLNMEYDNSNNNLDTQYKDNQNDNDNSNGDTKNDRNDDLSKDFRENKDNLDNKDLNNLVFKNKFELVLNVLVHDYVIFNNNLLVLDMENTLLGTLELKFLYQPSMDYNPLLLLVPVINRFLCLELLSKPNKTFKDKRYFVTEPWDNNSNSIVFKFTKLNFSIELDMNGVFQKVISSNGELTFNQDNDPDLLIKSLLESNFD